MADVNTNDNNNRKQTRNRIPMSIGSSKPNIPCKPTFLKARNNSEKEAQSSQNSNTVGRGHPRSPYRTDSSDHETPNVWSHPQPAKIKERRITVAQEFSKQAELLQSRFSGKWKPVPRPQSIESKREKFLGKDSTASNVESQSQIVNQKNSPLPDQSRRLASLKLQDDNVDFSQDTADSASPVMETKQKPVPRLHYRKSFSRDPKSPGFGTIRRMWDSKSDQPDTFVPRSFITSKPDLGKQKSSTKHRSYTAITPTNCVSWHHVKSPSDHHNANHNSHHTVSQDNSTIVGILSPKPFRTSSTSDEGCIRQGEVEHESRFNFEHTEEDFAEGFSHISTNFCQETSADERLPVKESEINQTKQNLDGMQSNCNIKKESLNADASVKEDVHLDKDEAIPADASVNNEREFDEDQRQMISALYDLAAADYFSHSSSSKEQSVDVSSHSDIHYSSSSSFPNQHDPSLQEGYLAMSSHTSTTPEIRYVEMAEDTEVEEVNYSSRIVLPPPVHLTKSKREYHVIDPTVPPPPDRIPPKLPQELKSQESNPPFADPVEEEQLPPDPPPLPPANSVGRRSVEYSKDKRFQVIQNLQENVSKSSKNKGGKRLNYIEVETVSKSNKTHPPSQGKTNYSDVAVISDGEFQQRQRSGSGTSEEGSSPPDNKKQKNVKKKIKSLFLKEDAKSSQSKEDSETLADFEKERNKNKRISARFLRKKNKDTAKLAKKQRASIPSMADVSIYVDNDSGFVTSSETSISGTPPVVASGGSSHSSGDGEVVGQPQGVASHYYGDLGDKIKWKVLPAQNSTQERRNDADMAPLVHATRHVPEIQNSSSHGKLESTFLAYPNVSAPAAGQLPHERIEKTIEPGGKVASFLHGSNESAKNAPFHGQRLPSGPPPPTLTKTNRLSSPGAFNFPDPAGSRSLPMPSHHHQHSQSEPKHRNLSLPGAVTPSPHKGDSRPPLLPPRLPKPSGLGVQTSSSSLRTQLEEERYEAAVDETRENRESLYMAAEDVPSPLPERDETLYESISATHVVPPSPLVKEDDTSKFLQSEPLYQIYRNRTMSHASSKRRVAKSVKEKLPAQTEEKREGDLSLEDLGTSTLWRTLPEVIASGWPEKLSTEEIKLQQAQFEVITSQASYLRSLNILVDHFMRDWAMESPEYLPSNDRHRLFSNIETVCTVERKFLQDLEDHFWKKIKTTRVCELIARYAKAEFKVYILYIQNQVYQDRVLTKLQRNNEKFADELCRLESSPGCNKLPLLSFLMLPMQRVTRLPLLVSAIVNAADSAGDPQTCKMAKHTLGVVNKLVKKCNEGARKMQQTEQLVEIASQLDYAPSVKTYALVSQSRSLVKKGEMTVSMTTDSKKATKTSKLWLFLFSDVLFIAKKKSYMEFGSSPRYEVIDWANRQFLAVNERAVTENAIFLVILENQAGKRIEMSLLPLAQNELPRWEKALNPPNLGVTGESIYETWDCPQYTCVVPYVAAQPDELSLEVGDIMQVLKKTSDGWLEGERLRDSESGWFPGPNCEEIEDEHVRSRNMKNLYRTSAAS